MAAAAAAAGTWKSPMVVVHGPVQEAAARRGLLQANAATETEPAWLGEEHNPSDRPGAAVLVTGDRDSSWCLGMPGLKYSLSFSIAFYSPSREESRANRRKSRWRGGKGERCRRGGRGERGGIRGGLYMRQSDFQSTAVCDEKLCFYSSSMTGVK